MTCHVLRGPDGRAVGFVCSRGSDRCEACGRAGARQLCDYPLAGRRAGETCDRRLCAGCATRVGARDLCPAHARLVKQQQQEEDLNDG
jgi:hypothetical protein